MKPGERVQVNTGLVGITAKRSSMTLVIVVAILAGSIGCATLNAAPMFYQPGASATDAHRPLPAAGFTVSPLSQTRVWLRSHPADPRAARLRTALGSRPDALWLTGGGRDLPNLTDLLALARRTSTTPIIALYNIPGRDDGITGPTALVSAAGYRAWVSSIAAVIGRANALIVIEPDALWLADRQFRRDPAGLAGRLASVRYAASTLARNPNASVYLDAGTSSGSVSPARMATLLRQAGVSNRIGFAVNVSSFAPRPAITSYAQRIRRVLSRGGVADAHYIVDTSRNGNPVWDNDTWCNPPNRTVGAPPSARPSPTAPGLDANVWVKAPGTSDGSCGVGRGSSGGDFLPDVALAMIR